MAISPSDILSDALCHLCDDVPHENEVVLRSAVRQMYYAIYHATDELDSFLSNHGGIEQGGVHSQRISKFKNYPLKTRPDGSVTEDVARTIRAFGHQMNALHSDRVKADYMLGADITLIVARQVKSDVKRAIQKLEVICSFLGVHSQLAPF
jgi:hypothetical protein